MFKPNFGKKEIEEINNKSWRNGLLEKGLRELEIAVNEQKGSKVIRVSTKAYGFLLKQGAKEKSIDKKCGGGYLNRCEKDNQIYECLTPSRVSDHFSKTF